MKEFERSLSPINPKNPRVAIDCAWMGDRIDTGHYNHLSVLETLDCAHLEHKIANAAKTIVFLFTPDIELLEHLEHNLHNYDNYHRTRLILKELVSNIHEARYQLENEVLRTRQQIQECLNQIHSLKQEIAQLEEHCSRKDIEIEGHRQSIIRLTQAYAEAKQCYKDELGQLRQTQQLQLRQHYQPQPSEPQHFLINISGEKESKVKRRGKPSGTDDGKLRVPSERKDSHLYTDRSMFQRFRAKPGGKQGQDSYNQESSQLANAILKVDQLEFEKQALQRKLAILEDEYKQAAVQRLAIEQRDRKENEKLRAQASEWRLQVESLGKRFDDRNRIIEELLGVIEGRE